MRLLLIPFFIFQKYNPPIFQIEALCLPQQCWDVPAITNYTITNTTSGIVGQLGGPEIFKKKVESYFQTMALIKSRHKNNNSGYFRFSITTYKSPKKSMTM